MKQNNNEFEILQQEIYQLDGFIKKMPTSINVKEMLTHIKYNSLSLWISIIHKLSIIGIFYSTTIIDYNSSKSLLVQSFNILIPIYFYVPVIYQVYFYRKHKEQLTIRQIKHCFKYNMFTISAFRQTLQSLNTYSAYLENEKNKPNQMIKNYAPIIFSAILTLQFGSEIKQYILSFWSKKTSLVVILTLIILLIVLMRIMYKQNKINKTKETISLIEKLQELLFIDKQLNYSYLQELSLKYPKVQLIPITNSTNNKIHHYTKNKK